jgi:hypothetical protein
MAVKARRMASWEAREMDGSTCCSDRFADDTEASGSGEGVAVDDAEIDKGDDGIDTISSGDEEDF